MMRGAVNLVDKRRPLVGARGVVAVTTGAVGCEYGLSPDAVRGEVRNDNWRLFLDAFANQITSPSHDSEDQR